jgi:type II protein arginine methyltransferase
MVHGAVGYFEARLYKDVYLSINPETKEKYNKNMFSWFPITFPIISPFKVKKNSNVVFNFSRNFDHQKVWYEWSISEPVVLPVHNTNGRSSWVGL